MSSNRENMNEENINEVNVPEIFNIFMNIMNINNVEREIIIPNNSTNLINQKIAEIIEHANYNMFDINNDIINYIENIYLLSLSYYDNYEDIIDYTISKLYYDNNRYSLKELTSGILNYSISGSNHTFYNNYDFVIDKIKYNLRINLRFDMIMFVINDNIRIIIIMM